MIGIIDILSHNEMTVKSALQGVKSVLQNEDLS
jgi:hypothetical protein